MSDQVKPALTPEEWALASPRTGFVESLDRTEEGRIVNKCCGCALPTAHGIAAFALHGQPFGFTREDVQILRECSKQQRDIEGDPEAIAYAGSLDYGTELESLAARIEALLPPEDTE